ncbi:MAG: ABC transporter ATP-binding protein [Eubacteriaceae bacterium]|nr:ABC transporter ATP-binding protein [Eubacteriaceae bacterium]
MLKLDRYLKPYTGKIALMVVMLFLQVLGTLYLPTLTAEIVNNGIVKGDIGLVWRTGFIMLGAAVLTAGISILETYLSISSFSAMGRDLRNDLFRKSQKLTISEFNSFGPASMITRCTHDVERVQEAYMEAVEMLLPAPVMAIAGLILAFRKSRIMALIIVASTFVACVLMILFNEKAIRLFNKLQQMLDGINRKVREILTGMRDIRAYNRELYEQARTDRIFEEFSGLAIRVNRLFSFMMPLIMTVMNICTILILIIGGNSVGAKTMEIGDIMAMIEYASLILLYMTMGIMVFMDMPQAQTCAGRILEVLECSNDAAEGGSQARSGVQDERIRRIVFSDVSFRYEDADEAVLNNINFTAEAGKTTAVIGSTGSGKTTLVNLIPRFFDPESGKILVNDTDIKDLPVDELRRHIGFVPQKAYLFNGKIEDTFLSGKEDASEEEMRRAAGTAQIGTFIDGLEDGYKSKVSQGGTNFSGGQRQRFAIARALVRRPDVYVFDDSFSALDFKTDSMLRSELKKEVGDAIVIIVAQRISTIKDADQIIVLDNGKVAGIGTHTELMNTCETYRQITRSQLREEEIS